MTVTSVVLPVHRRACERAHDLLDQDVGIGRFAVQRQRAGLGERHRAQVIDEPLHDAGLLEDRGEVRLVGRVDAIDHRLEVPGDHRRAACAARG